MAHLWENYGPFLVIVHVIYQPLLLKTSTFDGPSTFDGLSTFGTVHFLFFE